MRAGYHPSKNDSPEKNDLKKQGFYHSPAWRRLRLQALQRDHYLCQKCLLEKKMVVATEVHHVRSVSDYPELALDLDNLQSLCWSCHEGTKQRSAQRTVPKNIRVIKM